jgi:chromosome segregation ATPase
MPDPIVFTGLTATNNAVTAVTNVFKAVRDSVNAIRQAKEHRARLAEELCRLQDVLEQTKAKYNTKGVPKDLSARIAMKNLKNSVTAVELEIKDLHDSIAGLDGEMEEYRERIKAGPSGEITGLI